MPVRPFSPEAPIDSVGETTGATAREAVFRFDKVTLYRYRATVQVPPQSTPILICLRARQSAVYC